MVSTQSTRESQLYFLRFTLPADSSNLELNLYGGVSGRSCPTRKSIHVI